MWPGTPVALWMKRHNRWMWQRQRARTVYNNRKYVRPAVKTFKSVSCCGSRASTSRRRQLPRCLPHQEAPRGERPAGFHRINKTVTHKDRRRKGQTLVHNRRATARPKELSECSWRTDSHTHTQTDIYVKLVHVLILTSVCVFDVSLVFKLWSEEIYPRDTHPSCHPLQTACWWGTGSWSRIRQCCS